MSNEAPVLELTLPELEEPTQETPLAPDTETEEPAILEELIIEEVNIDGMCGVY
jgi:mycofactocin precursor